MKKDQHTWRFEEWGKKVDQLAEKIRDQTQDEAEKAGAGIKEWGKRLDELGEKIKKITQAGVEKVSGKTKGMVQITKLRFKIREVEKDIDSLTRQLGAKTYQLHLEKKIGNVELKKLGDKITQFKKDIEAKEKGIQRLREK